MNGSSASAFLFYGQSLFRMILRSTQAAAMTVRQTAPCSRSFVYQGGGLHFIQTGMLSNVKIGFQRNARKHPRCEPKERMQEGIQLLHRTVPLKRNASTAESARQQSVRLGFAFSINTQIRKVAV